MSGPSSESASIDSREFRNTCGKFATGVTIITTLGADDEPHGMTANSFTAVSLDPPLVLFCVDSNAGIVQHFRDRKVFGVNILGQTQLDLSSVFARRGVDRFENVAWTPGQTGVPILPDSIAVMEGDVQEVVQAGDHDIFVGRITLLECREGEPLLFYSGRYQSVTAIEKVPAQSGFTSKPPSQT